MMHRVVALGAAIAALSSVIAASSPAVARHVASPPGPLLAVTPYQRVPIRALERVPLGSEIEVVGYFSHKSPEIDGDLEVYLIDRHGYFVVVETPRRYKDMKYYVRSLRLHRNELVMARGALTQQHDKPTSHYRNGWMEINPVETVRRFTGPLPADLHYVRVVHRLFGRAQVTQI